MLSNHRCKTLVFFGVLLAGSIVASPAMSDAVKWKKRDGGNGHWYEAVFVPEGINWPEAEVEAHRRGCGYHLATITSPEEDEFVFDLIADKDEFFPDGLHGPWLGGFQRDGRSEPQGAWRWVTRESFDYENWGSGEPNNTFLGPQELAPGVPNGADENYLHYKKIFIWNDLPDNAIVFGYILELEIPRKSCRKGKH